MEKIAIYGGSFDPPHKGHLLLAKNLARACNAQRVIVMPAFLSPFKEKSGATALDRLNMCKLNFKDSLFEVSDLEIKRGGKSYTIETLKEIKALYPQSELYLFMGDDMFLSFTKWYKYEEILELCTVVTGCRTENLEKLQELKSFKDEYIGERAIICESVPAEMSSTQIRQEIKMGKGQNLAADVYEYINKRGLYL